MTTVREIADRYRGERPAERTLFVDFGDLVIETRVDDEGLHRELSDYFKTFLADGGPADVLVTAHETPAPDLGLSYTLKERGPGKTKIKEEWADLKDGRVVRKILTGMAFAFGNGVNVAAGPCVANPNQVINFINNRYIEHQLSGGAFLGHAAGVALKNRGLGMAGISGAGKSTLALHVVALGAGFVSNDRLMVEHGDDGLVMHGVAKHPRINPGTALNNPHLRGIVKHGERERFLAMKPEELWNVEHKYDALIEDCFGKGRFQLTAPMTGLVILNWRFDQGACVIRTVDPRKRRDLLPAFMKEPGLFSLPSEGASGERTVEEYAELLSRCTVIEMSGGVDFNKAARACMRFLETGDPGGEDG